MDANGEIEPFYADNIAYYVVNNNSGYEGDLEIALIPESFLRTSCTRSWMATVCLRKRQCGTGAFRIPVRV